MVLWKERLTGNTRRKGGSGKYGVNELGEALERKEDQLGERARKNGSAG